MAGGALMGALGGIWAVLAPASAGAADATANKQDTAAIQKPALPSEIPAPAAAPRAAQIEPVMVEPVKRVAPKAPENKIKQGVTIEEETAVSEKKPAGNEGSAKCEKVASVSKRGGKRR